MTFISSRIVVSTTLTAAVVVMSACSSGTTTGSNTSAMTPISTSASSAGRPVTPAPKTTDTKTTTVTASTPPPATSPPATSPTAASSPASTPPAAAACGNAQLALRSAPAQGGDSHGGVIVIFTNTASTSCTIYGYPGAAVLDKSGRQIVQATRTLSGYLGGCRCATPEHLRLEHSQSASAIVEGDNGGGDECLRGGAILATPPNTTKSARIPLQAYSCHVQVHPVVRGTSGTKH
jgi:hypothetical protein